jgi:hypothetical protein
VGSAVPGGPRHSKQISDRRHPVGRDARPYLTDSPTPSPTLPRLPIFRLPPRARFSRPILHVAGPDPSLQIDRRSPVGYAVPGGPRHSGRHPFRHHAVGRDARPYLTDSLTPSPDFPILPVSPFSACPAHRSPSHRPPRHLRCTFQPDPLGSTPVSQFPNFPIFQFSNFQPPPPTFALSSEPSAGTVPA